MLSFLSKEMILPIYSYIIQKSLWCNNTVLKSMFLLPLHLFHHDSRQTHVALCFKCLSDPCYNLRRDEKKWQTQKHRIGSLI